MRYGCSAPLVRKIICVPVSSFTLPPLQWMNESSGPPDAAEPKTRPGMPITPRLMLVSVVAGPAVPFVEVASVPRRPTVGSRYCRSRFPPSYSKQFHYGVDLQSSINLAPWGVGRRTQRPDRDENKATKCNFMRILKYLVFAALNGLPPKK
jgi:hypothetical protein